MKTPPSGTGGRWSLISRVVTAAAVGLTTLLAATQIHAATPAAGSYIGITAGATYTDSTGSSQSATSNLVQTQVTQVGSFSLTADTTKVGAPGNVVYVEHVLTNNGNGTDSFTLSLVNNSAGSTFNFDATQIYLEGADGKAINSALTLPYTTPGIAAGGQLKVLVALTIPGGASNAQTDTATITAAATLSSLYTTSSISNTDTVNVATAVPVFTVTKSISQTSGGVSAASCTGGTYIAANCVKATYTLTYSNNGTAAGPLYLKDVIGSGATAGFEYVAGSAKWNGVNALTDAVGGESGGIDYQSLSGTVQAVIASVAPGVTGTVSFDVGVKSTALVGYSTTSNTGSFATATGSTVALGTPATLYPTNSSNYTVGASYSVVINNGSATAGVPNDGDNATATGNDLVSQATAAAGSTVSFTSTVWNTGNNTDTFNLAYSGSTFPSGTTFAFYKSDGITPLSDSNADGAVDTGPMALGTSTPIVVKASIPGSACSPSCPAAPFTVTITATSAGDSTKSNKVFNQITTSLTGPTVTLGNGTTAPGTLWTVGSAAVTTLSVSGGSTASFDLVVNNTATAGSPSDTYSLQYSATNFTSGTLPVSGWTVVFKAGTCASGGSAISTVGPIAAGGNANVCAVVTTTSGSAAGVSDVYFRAISGATGAAAVTRDAVRINASGSLSLAPNGAGQVAANGSVVYAHTLTNNGNIACSAITVGLSETQAANGWTATIYQDTDGDGKFSSGDTALTGSIASLAIGASKVLFVKVFAPSSATLGVTDIVTVTASETTSCLSTATATDTSTVFSGQLRLSKTQALDLNCTGTPGAYGVALITAKPGACVFYQVTATNQGATPVTSVTISDSTPTLTTIFTPSGATSCSNSGTAVSPASTGTVSCAYTSIAANASVTMTFAVKINP